MSEYYTGQEGCPSIKVEDASELHDALDILHTQVIDNIGEDSPLLRVLESAMDKVQRLIDADPPKGGEGDAT